MLEHGVGQPEVAFRVFEVDRIDLVRHRRRADLAGLHLLLEEAERDVAPDVAVEVDQDRVGAREGVVQLGHRVVRLDLDRVGVEFEAERLDEALGEAFPVVAGIGRKVRVVVADRAVDLAEQADGGDARTGAFEAVDDVGQLLAHRRRRRRLAVRAAHHRHLRELMRQFAQAGADLVERRQHRLVARRLEHQCVRQVVDVFRGAREVDELADLHHLGVVRELLLDPVFERLHVVVGNGLDLLHLGRLLRAEAGDERVELGHRGRREGRNLGEVGFGGERLEPLDLDLQAATDQPVLRKLRAQRIDLAGIAAVERRKGSKGSERHGDHP